MGLVYPPGVGCPLSLKRTKDCPRSEYTFRGIPRFPVVLFLRDRTD